MNQNALLTLYHLYYTERPLTTTELAKRVFDPEDTDGVRNADNKVRHYLNETLSHLAVQVEEDPAAYEADTDRAHFGLGLVYVQSAEGEEITKGLGQCAVVDTEEGGAEVLNVTFGDQEGLPDAEALVEETVVISGGAGSEDAPS